jgi:hypothetical protein
MVDVRSNPRNTFSIDLDRDGPSSTVHQPAHLMTTTDRCNIIR